jgi:membrane protease subunit (stomatin/prohibitin family)
MSFLDRLRGELIDIVEWTGGDPEILVHKFERYGNEIKTGAKLTVREGQHAVFVNEGQIADVFPPGMYTLETANLPILSTLQGWKHGFASPFKAEVYFVVTRQFTDRKWGTKNPVMLRDPEFGPIRLRAFGSYAFRVSDPGGLVREITGSDGHFTAEGITDQLRNLIVSRFPDVLAERKLAALDLAANYDELGGMVRDRIAPEFASYGIDLTGLLVENVSLPPEVEEVLDKRTSMGIVGDMNAYSQFQAAQAMEKAAENPGGMAAGGIGMGMGFGMAQQMAQQMGQQASVSPPPPPPAVTFHVAEAGASRGPYDMQTMREQAAGGALTRSTMVWTQGMDGWKPAGEVESLRDIFAAVPPPPPPAA